MSDEPVVLRKVRMVEHSGTIFDEIGEPVARGWTWISLGDYRTDDEILADERKRILQFLEFKRREYP